MSTIDIDQRLGARIRTKRVAAGISLRLMAQRVGVSPTYLSMVERGLTKPSGGRLSQIHKALAKGVYKRSGAGNAKINGVEN